MTNRIVAASAFALTLTAAPAFAQTAMSAPETMSHPKLVQITIENLTTGQGFSPSYFQSHGTGTAALFELGQTASEPLWTVAEGGNIGPFSSMAADKLGTELGDAVVAVHTGPGATRSVVIRVDEAHPLLSGVWMLGRTNDGFSGFTGVDAYALTAPVSIDVMGYDAGSEINSERKGFLGALGEGNMRDPESGVIAIHAGIRGDADAPAEWKFDPALVARVTIAPVGADAL